MILNEQQIKSITRGAVNVRREADGAFHFYRFTDRQMDWYEGYNKGFWVKTKATSGINFDFYTDSARFAFDFDIFNGSSRNFYYFDVYVDGVLVSHLGESPMWIKHGTVEQKLPAGEHRVTVWFPNLACATVTRAELDDGASLRPAGGDKKMICWGDSISQGYDAVFPSLAYTNVLARHFDAYMINQAIGGEKFVPGLLDAEWDFKPDIITVAYGTNDWSGRTREEFFAGADGFLEGLAAQYPDAKIFIITPLWRGDRDKVTRFGSFDEACKYIADKAAACGHNVVNGYDLTPHWFEFYSDLRLHPNDMGYTEYAKNLIPRIEAGL